MWYFSVFVYVHVTCVWLFVYLYTYNYIHVSFCFDCLLYTIESWIYENILLVLKQKYSKYFIWNRNKNQFNAANW